MTPSRQLDPEKVAAELEVDVQLGLSSAEASARKARFGPNVLPEVPPPTLLTLLWRQVKSFIILLLLGAVALSLVLGEVGDAVAIFAALALNVVVGLLMDWSAERDIAALQSLTSPMARARRDGREIALPAAELIPGDILLLTAGDRVPADGRLLAGACTIDESLLTGESAPVDKTPEPLAREEVPLSERSNEVFAGSLIRAGGATAIVTTTGTHTEIGRIGDLLTTAARPPVPLNLRLESLGRYIVWTVAAITVVIVILGLWQEQPFWPLCRSALVLAVAAIPEGLPAVATLALAVGARRLLRHKLRLRYLGALEALGGITTLCLDKTGTLTANAMTARVVRVDGHDLTVSGEGWAPAGEFQASGKHVEPTKIPALLDLLRSVQLCNEATLENGGETNGEKEEKVALPVGEVGWHIHGDPSEGALLTLAAKAGLADPRTAEGPLRTIAAGAEHPWMAVVLREPDGVRAYVKGAPEQVLMRCTTVRTAMGSAPLDEARRADWLVHNRRMADQALRVFAVAVSKPGLDEQEVERDWEWLGLVGMADPPRPGVKEALALAHRAGIRTLMITGDQPATAAAIARELDLADGREPRVLVGAEAPAVDVDVYARATPEGKYRLVRALQERGQAVAMTGDGVNDAPALRAAVAGIAMGSGTDVAKQAAAIILMDENLSTLLLGVREGRTVFLNIQRALDYLLSCSVAMVLAIFIATALGFPPLLLPLQVLYLNLLMHTFPALGLTLEPADPSVMERPPLPREAKLLSPAKMAAVLWHGIIIAVATLAVFSWGQAHGGAAHGRSLAFATLATSLMLHTFSDRSSLVFGGWRLRRNPAIFGFVGIAVALQLLALYLPGLRHTMGMTPFHFHDWMGILGAAAGTVIAIELSKLAWAARVN